MMTNKPTCHTPLSSREMLTQLPLVLAVSSAIEQRRVLGLAMLFGNLTHALVELVQLSLGALGHSRGSGGGAEIH
jgi:hypothetical protein